MPGIQQKEIFPDPLGEIRERVRQLWPKFIVTDELRLDQVAEAVRDLDYVKEIFVIGKANNGFTSISDLVSNNENSKTFVVSINILN